MGIRAKALQRAAEIVGGRERLRELLRVSRNDLEAWLDGGGEPPLEVFFRAVDIISGVPVRSEKPPSATVQHARDLRARIRATRETIAVTRERSAAICAAVVTGRLASAARRGTPMSALGFLHTRFEPDDGARMVDSALRAAVAATGADMGTLQIVQPEGLLLVAHSGFAAPFLDYFACVYDDDSACGTARTKGERVIVADVAGDPIFAGKEAGAVMLTADARAVQSTPLLGPSGTLVGMLSTHYDHRRHPGERELDIVDHIARRAAFWLDGGEL